MINTVSLELNIIKFEKSLIKVDGQSLGRPVLAIWEVPTTSEVHDEEGAVWEHTGYKEGQSGRYGGDLWSDRRVTWQLHEEESVEEGYPNFPHPPSLRCHHANRSLSANTTRASEAVTSWCSVSVRQKKEKGGRVDHKRGRYMMISGERESQSE